MQYDFNLAPNAGMSIDVAGKFFKYKSGAGPIRIRTSKGGVVDLLPGQGVWNTDFTGLTITDKSGLQNAGVILAGDFDFHDDRVTGTVDVVDGGRTRTLAGAAFIGSCGSAPLAGQFSVIGMYNPVGSGKNMYIEQFSVASSKAGKATIAVGATQIVNNQQGPVYPNSKKVGGNTSACVLTRSTQAAPGVTGSWAYMLDALVQANQPFPYRFIEPLLLSPGFGLALIHDQADAVLFLTTEHFEEPV